ncbi:chemotaxis protein methyltransferase CheR [Archangium gephyra]|uniref:Chemotaxis protein methyltransferase CheR n=1 Tax=Archangium gephyra TaxID=48 RepID=A0AAC8QB21_9BACT|nr:protein-glutamate O-methyltransferase [Archangium gephyra]AKJ04402.1 Chemotaxis protein methyltransferase CheR [Archangium gephyra]REG37522.1 chemotaxis protein methyltransferase CheR [Archangium gephyra]
MLTVTSKALQQLSSLLLERAGLKITPDGYHSLRLALSTRMPVVGIVNAEEYVKMLRSAEDELRSLLPLVTVGHTEFFRDPKQFRALESRILPDALWKARRENRRVSIWSAGCATGEEPYSLAMVLAEQGALPIEVDLWATDLNLAAVEAAKQGRFSSRRVAGMHGDRRTRFFRPVEDGYEIVSSLKDYVRFDGQNLAVPVFEKVKPESLDLILCRNVIIYFDLPTIRALMDRFLAALRPGALLLLGYSESLFKVYDRFEMVEMEGAFVYRRPVKPLPPRTPIGTGNTKTYSNSALLPSTRALKTTLDTSSKGPSVSPASRKTVEVPASKAPEASPAANPVSEPSRKPLEASAVGAEAGRTRTSEMPAWSLMLAPGERLNAAVRMIERGDFVSAVNTVEQLLSDEPGHLDALLTLGNIYSLSGRVVDARDAFAQAINREPLCVEARVFGGLAELQAGELAEARAELGKALFLEPSLAIGHYLMAQVHERLKDHEAARRHYRNAISQLRFPQRQLAGHYPELPDSAEAISRAARYALAALEEGPLL